MAIGFWPDISDYRIDELSSYFEDAGIEDAQVIDLVLAENKEVLKRYIANIYANRKNNWKVTPGFLCELVVILMAPKIFTEEYLVEKGWCRDLAKIVLSSARLYTLKHNL